MLRHTCLKAKNQIIVTLRHTRLKTKKSNSYTHSCKTYCLLTLGHTRLKAKSQIIVTLGHTRLKAKKSNNYTHSCKLTRGFTAQTHSPQSKKVK